MSLTPRNAVRSQLPPAPTAPSADNQIPPAELFGRDVFNIKVMRERLPKAVSNRFLETLDSGAPLDAADADVIASAMKDWAIERGASHYTHWFQPMTGLTAEKHDAFLAPNSDGNILNEFSGKMLIKGEPDASSFPSGGLRSTFEARGYTAWDPTSPAFLLKCGGRKTLYVPTIFLSHTGEALDRKAPLLRSLEAISKQALRILRFFGDQKARWVTTYAGPEQEYFLVDSRYAALRPDLRLAGRTLFGAPPSKGQELEDHYFGAISPRVQAFMTEVENRLWALGIPARTRHNEVAPAQFELAPLYERANLAVDHNMLVLKVLRDTAGDFGLTCLLHEKPFAGVNGSGKHNNWSLGDSEGRNLLEPGRAPWQNTRFMVFLAAVLRAVHVHSIPLRIGVAGAGNDHRLGANEAPPAIISVFLSEQLTEVVKGFIQGLGEDKMAALWQGSAMEAGIASQPAWDKDISDRNRTSPFAFTGNKFEFRAVGSSQSIAPANIALNAAVACALDDIATELEAARAGGAAPEEAARQVLSRIFEAHLPVVFNGNNYTAEWAAEAQRRGLPNLRDTVATLARYNTPEGREAFLRHGVLTERELLARQEILLENYIKVIHVETKLCQSMGRGAILPVALKALAGAVEAVRRAGQAPPPSSDGYKPEDIYYRKLHRLTAELMRALDELDARHVELDAMTELLPRAESARDILLPLMARVRAAADGLELLIDDADWPLPKYNELLWPQ
ncbi:MAG: glutamine synthetase III [Candidatus Adiutrix sp.]|jgi:glutamine synthetase|nr:glutamine synthetase III [Candidatus Adiutrix sp.]